MNSTQPQNLSDCCASSLRTHLASCSLQYKYTKVFLIETFISSFIYKYLLNQKKLTHSGVFFTKQVPALKTPSTIYL